MTTGKSKRLQITVTAAMAAQIDELATRIGVPVSVMGKVLISAGLARVTGVLDDPDPAVLLQVLRDVKVQGNGAGD